MAVCELRVGLRHLALQPPNLSSFRFFRVLLGVAPIPRPAGACRCRTRGGMLFASCATRHSSSLSCSPSPQRTGTFWHHVRRPPRARSSAFYRAARSCSQPYCKCAFSRPNRSSPALAEFAPRGAARGSVPCIRLSGILYGCALRERHGPGCTGLRDPVGNVPCEL
jgi:hypothetical protein